MKTERGLTRWYCQRLSYPLAKTHRLQGGIGGEKVTSSSKGKATATNSTKKRAASLQVATTEQEGGVTPKKAKVRTLRYGFPYLRPRMRHKLGRVGRRAVCPIDIFSLT